MRSSHGQMLLPNQAVGPNPDQRRSSELQLKILWISFSRISSWLSLSSVCVCVSVKATWPLMKNLFYFAVNLAADKEIDGTGELMFTLLGQLLITDSYSTAAH